jgi:hypothetical protein
MELVHGNGPSNKIIPKKTFGKNPRWLLCETLATVRAISLVKIVRNLLGFGQSYIKDARAFYSLVQQQGAAFKACIGLRKNILHTIGASLFMSSSTISFVIWPRPIRLPLLVSNTLLKRLFR